MKAFGYIYSARCKESGKVYVGQTTSTVNRRLRGHMYQVQRGSEMPFHRALRKYGLDGFEISTVEECFSIEALNLAEKNWIEKLSAFGPLGYNCTTGGEGFIVGAETRARISKARTGSKVSDATRQRISEATRGEKNHFYGKHHKPESIEVARLKISEKLSGDKNPFYGKRHPRELQDQINQKNSGKPMHPNTRAGIAKANLGNSYTKGLVLSPERKAQISAASKGRKFSPEHKARISEALKGKAFSAERKANISSALRAMHQAKKEVNT